MKTYEQTISDLFARKAEYDKQMKKRKKLTSTVAAVAAALILFTALPVGAFIISRQTKQPAEIPTPEQTEPATTEVVQTSDFAQDEPHNVELCDLTVSTNSSYHAGSPVYEGTVEFSTRPDGLTDGRFRLITNIGVYHTFSPEADNYQADIIVTDGENEVYRFTYTNEESAVGILHTRLNFDLFIPEELKYGEIAFYFNILDHNEKSIAEYGKEPFCKRTVIFMSDYGCFFRYEFDWFDNSRKEEAEKYFCNDVLPRTMYGRIKDLYLINKLEAFGTIDSATSIEFNGQTIYLGKKDRETKEFLVKTLTAYKADHPDVYAELIEEFKSSQPITYDKDGNPVDETDYWQIYHDPLNDLTP